VEWLELLGKRCKEVGAVLIYDEIQVSVSTLSIDPRLTSSAVYSEQARCGLILDTLKSHSKLLSVYH
jgi:hypothetical protein